jgi:hypothetical protein
LKIGKQPQGFIYNLPKSGCFFIPFIGQRVRSREWTKSIRRKDKDAIAGVEMIGACSEAEMQNANQRKVKDRRCRDSSKHFLN